MEQTRRQQLHEQARAMILRWFRKHFNLQHTSHGFIGVFGVWDVMGDNNLDKHVFVNGKTKHLIEMRDMLIEAIDNEIEKRTEANVRIG